MGEFTECHEEETIDLVKYFNTVAGKKWRATELSHIIPIENKGWVITKLFYFELLSSWSANQYLRKGESTADIWQIIESK